MKNYMYLFYRKMNVFVYLSRLLKSHFKDTYIDHNVYYISIYLSILYVVYYIAYIFDKVLFSFNSMSQTTFHVSRYTHLIFVYYFLVSLYSV